MLDRKGIMLRVLKEDEELINIVADHIILKNEKVSRNMILTNIIKEKLLEGSSIKIEGKEYRYDKDKKYLALKEAYSSRYVKPIIDELMNMDVIKIDEDTLMVGNLFKVKYILENNSVLVEYRELMCALYYLSAKLEIPSHMIAITIAHIKDLKTVEFNIRKGVEN